ncbi:MAG: ABC transporter substrate-binding protein [Clostridiaceae bacterium]|nr:ABC transporter substrate-binding protein [Clostridiaceae bacterium]
MKLRVVPYILFIGLLLLMLPIGCIDINNNLSAPEQKKTVKIIAKRKKSEFWDVVRMGAEAAGKEFNVNVEFWGPTNELEIDKQIEMVREVINEKVDALVLAACDYVRLVEPTEEVIAAKIPVIVIDSDLKSDKVKSFIGTDNVGAGYMVGKTLVDTIGKNGNVAVMSFIKGAASADQREEGFFNAIKDYPGINIVTTEYCSSNIDLSESLTYKILNEHGEDLDAIAALNADSTVGVARAIEKRGFAGKIRIVGFDSTPDEIDFLERDVIDSLIIQNPFSMGYLGVKYAVDVMNGKPVPKIVDTGSRVINKDNMYLPENQKLLFPLTDE